MRKWLYIVLVVVIVAGGFAYWQNNQARSRTAIQRTQQSFATARVKKETIESTLSGTASIVFSDKRTVQSSVEGTLARIVVRDGAEVKAGDVLAVIDNPALLDEAEKARTELATAELRIETLRTVTPADRASADNKVQQCEEVLSNRRADLKKLTVAAPVDGRVSAVRARIGDSATSGTLLMTIVEDGAINVVAQVSQTDISRVSIGNRATVGFGSELPAGFGAVSAIAVEAVSGTKSATIPVTVRIDNPDGVYRAGLTANVVIYYTNSWNRETESVSAVGTVSPLSRLDVKAEVAGTVESIRVKEGDSVKAGAILAELKSEALLRAVKYAENDLTVVRQSYESIQKGYAPNVKETDIRQAESQLRQAETTLRAREDKVNALQVRAPIDGVILSHSLSEGLPVVSGTNLFAIADPAKMHMVVQVDELDVMQVRPGQKATIIVDAIPGRTFSGTVTKVAAEGVVREGVANYDVTITLDATNDLKGSMTGTATVVLSRKENVLAVPSEAIRSDGRRRTVNVMKNGTPTQVEVQVGVSGNRLTEITQGLSEGDTVVLSSVQQRNQQQQPVIRVPGSPVPMGPR